MNDEEAKLFHEMCMHCRDVAKEITRILVAKRLTYSEIERTLEEIRMQIRATYPTTASESLKGETRRYENA